MYPLPFGKFEIHVWVEQKSEVEDGVEGIVAVAVFSPGVLLGVEVQLGWIELAT
jgi:hypothetical protein